MDNSQGIIYTIAADGTMNLRLAELEVAAGTRTRRDNRPRLPAPAARRGRSNSARTFSGGPLKTGALQHGIEYRVFHKDGSFFYFPPPGNVPVLTSRIRRVAHPHPVRRQRSGHNRAQASPRTRIHRLLEEKEILLSKRCITASSHMNIMTSSCRCNPRRSGAPKRSNTALGRRRGGCRARAYSTTGCTVRKT